ncbi:MAG: ABC transporter substrate-binding protein [Clostridia bacterium]
MRKINTALLVLVSCVLLAATTLSAAPSGKVNLRFWTTHIYGPELEQAMKALLDEWHRENPDIVVTYENIPGGDVQAKFMTAAKGDSLPDIVDGWSYQALQLAQMGKVLPLDDIYAQWTKSGELADIVSESAYRKFYWKGHYWGIPWALDIRVIAYRKDLLEKKGIPVPTTWEDFEKAVLALHDPKNNIYGLTHAAGFFHFAGQTFVPFMVQAGGGILNKDGKLVFATDNFEANLKALKFMTSFATVHKVTPPGIGSYDWDDSCAIFLAGRAAFSMERGNVITRLLTERPDLAPNVRILPALKGPAARVAAGFCNPLFISADTKYPAEAKKFILWLTDKGHSMALFKARPGQMWPVRKSDYKDPFFKSNHLLNDVVEGVLPYIVDMAYPAPGVPEMGAIDGEKMFAAPVNDVITGTKTPEEALKAAHKNMQRVFDESKATQTR